MIVPFKAEHLGMVQLQSTQAYMTDEMRKPEYAKMLENSYAYSLIDGDEVLCCAGIMPIWNGRAMAWALMSKNAGRKFIEIHKNVSAALRLCPERRVEMAVDSEFPEGKRWARMLGMTYEGKMKAYSPDGRDCDLYARVK